MSPTITICDPGTNRQKAISVDWDGPEAQIYSYLFLDGNFKAKKLGDIVPGEIISPMYRGYMFKITGGNDRNGFCMRQGIMTNRRVRILMRRTKKE